MRRGAGTLAALTVLLAACAAAAPVAAHAAPPPRVEGAAAIVIDARDGHVLWSRNPNQPRAIASTTKLMTALLTLERARLGDVFTAPAYHPGPAESRIDLAQGERMTVGDLLEALLLESANDAAVTLAKGVAGSERAFVEAMNERAHELGLDETSYANPVGLDAPGGHSTARDLAALAARLMRNHRFARIVDTPEARLESGNHPRVVENRNLLIGTYPFVTGVKTGHTTKAGYVLVGAAGTARTGRVVSVVMGEPSEAARDVDTVALLRFGLGRFSRVRVLDRRRAVARVGVDHRDEDAELVPARRLEVTLRKGERVRRAVDAPDSLDGPLAAGSRVGSVTVLVDGRRVGRVPVLTSGDVPGAGLPRVVVSAIGLPMTMLILLLTLLCAALAVLRVRVRLRLVR